MSNEVSIMQKKIFTSVYTGHQLRLPGAIKYIQEPNLVLNIDNKPISGYSFIEISGEAGKLERLCTDNWREIIYFMDPPDVLSCIRTCKIIANNIQCNNIFTSRKKLNLSYTNGQVIFTYSYKFIRYKYIGVHNHIQLSLISELHDVYWSYNLIYSVKKNYPYLLFGNTKILIESMIDTPLALNDYMYSDIPICSPKQIVYDTSRLEGKIIEYTNKIYYIRTKVIYSFDPYCAEWMNMSYRKIK